MGTLAVTTLSTEGVLASLLPLLAPVDALQLAQVSKAVNEAVRGSHRYWYLQCCSVKNMRGQKVNHWTDYRRLFLTTVWQKQRQQLWTAQDQKHWSRLWRRKRLFDRMEDALGERQEMELLREVLRNQTDKLLAGKYVAFFESLAPQLNEIHCSCRGRQGDTCAKHDKLCVRAALHQHMSAWLEDSLTLGSAKEHIKTMKMFEDKVRQVWKVCQRVQSKKWGKQIHFQLGRGTLVYTVSGEKRTSFKKAG